MARIRHTDLEMLDLDLLAILIQKDKPLNNAQICRLFNGAESELQMSFCRSDKIIERGEPNLKKYGFQYENCKKCLVQPPTIAQKLKRLASFGIIKTKYLRHRDPQKKGNNWDRMRYYGFDLSPILKEHIDQWC